MGGRWNPFGFLLSSCTFLMLFLAIQKCCSLNLEGVALLEFRARVDSDPHGAFANWDPNDSDPCTWFGVQCADNRVQILDLKELSLEGVIAPELGKLGRLKSLVLYNNCFSGVIPKEIGGLTMLEVLDLRGNKLNGTIPAEIGGMLSLKRLLLCDNKFHGNIPPELGKLNFLSELQFDQDITSAVGSGIGCLSRKFGHCIWRSSLNQLEKADSFIISIKHSLQHYLDLFPSFKFGKGLLHGHKENSSDNLPTEPYVVQHVVNFVRHRLLEESINLAAEPASVGALSEQMITLPITQSSGAFPAIPNEKKHSVQSSAMPSSVGSQSNHSNIIVPKSQSSQTSAEPADQQSSANGSSGTMKKYIFVVPSVAILLTVAAALIGSCRNRGMTTIGPWRTGLSGQLQKAFITGVPKLNRSELETACEDFSNIIDTLPDCTVFKGTLSSGVEIAVASSAIASSKHWSKHSEMAYRKKIDTLSRVNHKNFVNLLGYCEEDEPFFRMMVFEYAPNGTLFEHLHVKEVEHLDWNTRMRIIMGTAYCLQYMHHELNPPVAHPNLQSSSIFLTDDYAAKIADISFWVDMSKPKVYGEELSEHSELPPLADPETNVYSFGLLLLEIISGKPPTSDEQGSLVNWAVEYLNDKRSISYMIDPTLKSFKNNELDIICEVIQDCVDQDPRQRPTMREVTSKLREVIGISPDAATPRLSPLWWAELEILSVEAT